MLRHLALLAPCLLLFALATPALPDSFLTDEGFFPLSETQLQRLDSLSWQSLDGPLAALRDDPDPLFHMRLITRSYFKWLIEEERLDLALDFLDALSMPVYETDAPAPLARLDYGYACLLLADDLNGLAHLEAACARPGEQSEGDGPAPAEDPGVYLALALCYAQADTFILQKPWEHPTGIKLEAVRSLHRAAALALAHPKRAAYQESLSRILDYMFLYEGFVPLLLEYDVRLLAET